MRLYMLLILTVLSTWRDAWNRRNPALQAHGTRWSLFSGLTVLLYPLVFLPLCVLLYVVHHAPHDTSADVIHLDSMMCLLLIGTMGLMVAAGSVLSGIARTTMNEFRDHRWASLILGTAAAGFLLYIGYTAVMMTSLLDVTKGDNGMLAAFMAAWVWAITRVCNVPIDRARDNWDLGLPSLLRK